MLKYTPTEFIVAAHITDGKIVKEIASKLFRSYHTVTKHLRNFKLKNGLKNSADIAREFALEFGHPKHYISIIFLAIQFNMLTTLDENLKRFKNRKENAKVYRYKN